MYTAKNKNEGIYFTPSLHLSWYKNNPQNYLTLRATLFSKQKRITLQICLFAKKINAIL